MSELKSRCLDAVYRQCCLQRICKWLMNSHLFSTFQVHRLFKSFLTLVTFTHTFPHRWQRLPSKAPSANYSHTHTLMATPLGGNMGFSGLLKDNLTHWSQRLGIEPQILWSFNHDHSVCQIVYLKFNVQISMVWHWSPPTTTLNPWQLHWVRSFIPLQCSFLLGNPGSWLSCGHCLMSTICLTPLADQAQLPGTSTTPWSLFPGRTMCAPSPQKLLRNSWRNMKKSWSAHPASKKPQILI